MRLEDLLAANERALEQARQVRPVTTGDISRRWRKSHPYRGWVELDTAVGPLTVFCNNDDLIALTALWNGTCGYEPGSLAVWADLVARSRGVVDVGAHVGIYSLVAAAVNPKVRVVAFEAAEHIYARLVVNLSANRATSVAPVRAAVTDRDGEAELMLRHGGMMTTASTLEPDGRGTPRTVPAVTLDRRLAGMPVDVIKVDVEGHEPSVLRGARETLARCRPAVLLEVLRGAEPRTTLELLPDGYEGWWVSERDGALWPLDGERPAGSRNVVCHS